MNTTKQLVKQMAKFKKLLCPATPGRPEIENKSLIHGQNKKTQYTKKKKKIPITLYKV